MAISPKAQAAIAGDWYLWFPVTFTNVQIDRLAGYFNGIDERSRVPGAYFVEWSVLLDMYLWPLAEQFGGRVTGSISLAIVNGEPAFVSIIRHHGSGFLAARVERIVTDGTRQLAEIITALGCLNETLSSYPYTYKQGSEVVKNSHFRVARPALLQRGYFYSIRKIFLSPNSKLATMASLQKLICNKKEFLMELPFCRTSIRFLDYSFWRQMVSFLPFVSKFKYLDQMTNKVCAKL